MDRKGQLQNVAFGGAWSEQIAGNEAMTNAMQRIEAAVRDTEETDLRSDADLAVQLAQLAAAHPKGPLLVAAWQKALGVQNATHRMIELDRIAKTLRAGLIHRLTDPPR